MPVVLGYFLFLIIYFPILDRRWVCVLEGTFRLNMHRLARYGMAEVERRGMKHQAAGVMSVQVVSDNRHTQSVAMCAVYSQLMSSSCLWVKRYSCRRTRYFLNVILCHSLFAVLIIYLLPWTVYIV